ncbi:MAG: cytidylate kinase family protein, partial [Acidobacteria bacterium]|nr:cytidylate kinase family protein [Acidobacteriota bacterium]
MQHSKTGEHYESAHLVERQMLFRDARERVERPGAEGARSARYRFLTISRQIGSLGGAIVQELAGNLCWQVYDREIVDSIARSAHVRQRLVEQLDEKAQNLVHETVRRFLRMAEGGSFGLEEYHEGLLRTLAGLAGQGSAILVGRGANFALYGEKGGLHVRVVASDGL